MSHAKEGLQGHGCACSASNLVQHARRSPKSGLGPSRTHYVRQYCLRLGPALGWRGLQNE
ncbi:unnamed protein product [Dibothriocephalus latus]|uniref:Uncharacterized protein n=1 Tax=Dibothriocephalus latus TaxID=60516 RepID=A0A3P7MJR5_DIBLA|nr:unnamed protein product [Dibothriocephalus latus]